MSVGIVRLHDDSGTADTVFRKVRKFAKMCALEGDRTWWSPVVIAASEAWLRLMRILSLAAEIANAGNGVISCIYCYFKSSSITLSGGRKGL